MKPKFLFSLLIIPLSTNAQITTDGTLGQALNLPGPDYQISADLGQPHGGNLFHSFQDFNLQHFESATYDLQPSRLSQLPIKITSTHHQQPNQNLTTHPPRQPSPLMTCQSASYDPLETPAMEKQDEKVIPEQLF